MRASSVWCRLPPAAAVPASPPLLPSQALPSGGLGTPSPAGGVLSSSPSLGQFRSASTSFLGLPALVGFSVMVAQDVPAISADDLRRQRIACMASPLGFWSFWMVKKSL